VPYDRTLLVADLAAHEQRDHGRTNVSESTNAATSAKITVVAIGVNIFPSTPVSARIGM